MVLINPSLEGIRKVIPFPKGVSPKVNVIARLEFELAYYDVTIQNVSHYTTSPRSAVAKVLDCNIVESKFEPQSRYYVRFQINTLGKGMNNLIPKL